MTIDGGRRKSRDYATSGSTSVAQRKFNLTRERIEALRRPTNGQRAYYYDTKVRGLAVAVTAARQEDIYPLP